ncbi:hypothetical protein JTB14_005216 [Gonioctena quinquepunctata]|nr:hypothetical protein JTB14_005216 [Gonioctena quinquepunctata]
MQRSLRSLKNSEVQNVKPGKQMSEIAEKTKKQEENFSIYADIFQIAKEPVNSDVEDEKSRKLDWSEISSAGTLRSASIATPSTPEHHHLPSYLSLACTVNGYSTTTHYDPVRLAARSRDASPHRIDAELTPANRLTYSVQNNLLSPPNLVPLPQRVEPPRRMENALAQQHRPGEFYTSMKTTTYLSKETFTSGLFGGIAKDATDGCLENGHHGIQSKVVSFESKSVSSINGGARCVSETSMGQEYQNGQETKSFIQQRVERLYGPGALAQGFFKPQKKRLSECEDRTSSSADTDKHSKSMTERSVYGESEPAMRQSTSSPTLPVMRHLRPEFRAQLPIISPKKGALEGGMQKSVTLPKLKEEGKANGHAQVEEKTNGVHAVDEVKEETEKDGHHFLLVIEVQAKRLLKLAARVEEDISTPGLSEEMVGRLRSAAGKAKLLVTQKMQQFRGLCANNINRSDGEAFPTTNEDLQGFWDMVMLQVDQVDAIFREIEALKANDWQEVVKVAPKAAAANGTAKAKKSAPRPVSAASEEARKQREAQRKKMIEDRRRAMKVAQQNKPSIEIFVAEATS